MKFRKAEPVNRAGLDANSTITRAQATRLIAGEIAVPGEQPPITRNRVSQRIRYAIKHGKLAEQSPGKFRFGDLAAWARRTWPGKFSGWLPHRAVSDTYVPVLGMNARTSVDCGSDVAEWRRYAASVENERDELRGLRSEIETLRPYREKKDQTRARNAATGRLGGRGNKS